VLGVWACAAADLEVPNRYWKAVDTAWRRGQQREGGWSYFVAGTPTKEASFLQATPAMTSAGVATLLIVRDFLALEAQEGDLKDPALDAAVNWMIAEQGQRMLRDTGQVKSPLYTLYNVERVGIAGGYRRVNGFDWYAHGARYLLGAQKPDGNWTGTPIGSDVADTAFGILFLSAGRTPVAASKLRYSEEDKSGKRAPGHWNRFPRDLANVTDWLARVGERKLTWQQVGIEDPVTEWLDAPILYLAGDRRLTFADAEVAKLKEYVDRSGLIVGVADGGARPFVDAFRQLGTRMYPTYEFRQLTDDHPLLAAQQFPAANWRRKAIVESMGNGVRELLVLIPSADLGRVWGMRLRGQRPEAYELFANLHQYAAGSLTPRRRWAPQVDQPAGIAARTIKLARIEYSGNWNAEPLAWQSFGRWLQARDGVAVDAQPVKLGEGKLAGYDVAHLSGTVAFRFADAQRDELKAFLARGGRLLVDAAGGSATFADAFVEQMTPLVDDPASLHKPLAMSHPLFKTWGGDRRSECGDGEDEDREEGSVGACVHRAVVGLRRKLRTTARAESRVRPSKSRTPTPARPAMRSKRLSRTCPDGLPPAAGKSISVMPVSPLPTT
jgi:hypothetical protein